MGLLNHVKKDELDVYYNNGLTKKGLLSMLEKNAKEYRLECKDSLIRNRHMHTIFPYQCSPNLFENMIHNIQQDVIDAILVDFINYVGVFQGLDLGLHTYHLKDK